MFDNLDDLSRWQRIGTPSLSVDMTPRNLSHRSFTRLRNKRRYARCRLQYKPQSSDGGLARH
jgi:hypothetical protein